MFDASGNPDDPSKAATQTTFDALVFCPDLSVKASESTSYSQILKSSSIIGGAQAINYVVGMVRTKLVAVLLGPSGVGLLGLYVSITTLIGKFSGLGIATSGVREIAQAQAKSEPVQLARATKNLRRACWLTGILGWVLSIVLAYPLSLFAFGSAERTTALALLGLSLLFSSISAGQTALLQGIRRIQDLARVNVIGAVASTIVAVGFYAWLGEGGIVPALIATAGVTLGVSWWFARSITVVEVDVRWSETWRESKSMVHLGLAFMWSGLLAAGVALAVRSAILQELGMEANGYFQAAWGMSGVFAGFILSAMGADFYPRLAAVASDDLQMNRLVNEQTEVGILLALPGLVASLSFAPWIMQIFYSSRFTSAATLLPWFILAIFGQVISWPMGYALLAKGATAWYVVTESCANLLLLLLSLVLLKWLGLWGTALAFAILYVEHTLLLSWACHRQTRFRWSLAVLKLVILSAAMILLTMWIQRFTSGVVQKSSAFLLTIGASLFCIRALAARLGPSNRILRAVRQLPLFGRLV